MVYLYFWKGNGIYLKIIIKYVREKLKWFIYIRDKCVVIYMFCYFKFGGVLCLNWSCFSFIYECYLYVCYE